MELFPNFKLEHLLVLLLGQYGQDCVITEISVYRLRHREWTILKMCKYGEDSDSVMVPVTPWNLSKIDRLRYWEER